MADTLQKLFGSIVRVKLLRLFLFNSHTYFTIGDAAKETQSKTEDVRREIGLLERVGLLEKDTRQSVNRYRTDSTFEYLDALRNLILNAPVRGQDIYEKLEPTGLIKLIVTAGMFVGESETSLDLLIVGDKINEAKLKDRIRALEAELGKELKYTVLSSEDFFYRLTMNDRLVRDVFDFPHRIIHDRLDIGLK